MSNTVSAVRQPDTAAAQHKDKAFSGGSEEKPGGAFWLKHAEALRKIRRALSLSGTDQKLKTQVPAGESRFLACRTLFCRLPVFSGDVGRLFCAACTMEPPGCRRLPGFLRAHEGRDHDGADGKHNIC